MAFTVNVSADDLRKMDLGKLVRKTVLFDDAISGTRVIEHEYELGTVNETIWYGQDVFLDAVKEQRNTGSPIDNKSVMGTKVATIPMHIWAREVAPRQKDGNQASLKRWLNDGAGQLFKIRDGKI